MATSCVMEPATTDGRNETGNKELCRRADHSQTKCKQEAFKSRRCRGILQRASPASPPSSAAAAMVALSIGCLLLLASRIVSTNESPQQQQQQQLQQPSPLRTIEGANFSSSSHSNSSGSSHCNGNHSETKTSCAGSLLGISGSSWRPGVFGNDNQSAAAYQSDPSSLVPVGRRRRQQQQRQRQRQREGERPSSAFAEMELYPSQRHDLAASGLAAIATTTDGYSLSAFNKCNSSDRTIGQQSGAASAGADVLHKRPQQQQLSKQSTSIKAAPIAGQPREPTGAADRPAPLRRVRRHVDVGARGKRSFVGHHRRFASAVGLGGGGGGGAAATAAAASATAAATELEWASSSSSVGGLFSYQQQQQQQERQQLGRKEVKRNWPIGFAAGWKVARGQALGGGGGGGSNGDGEGAASRTSTSSSSSSSRPTTKRTPSDVDDNSGSNNNMSERDDGRSASLGGNHEEGARQKISGQVGQSNAGRLDDDDDDDDLLKADAAAGDSGLTRPILELDDYGDDDAATAAGRRRRQQQQHASDPNEPAKLNQKQQQQRRPRRRPSAIGSAASAGHDQIISHYNLIEFMDDDLFLADESPPVRHEESIHHFAAATARARPSREAAGPSSGGGGGGSGGSELSSGGDGGGGAFNARSADKIRTIYFGGFFPWLADEDTARFRVAPPSLPNGDVQQQQQQQQRARQQMSSNSSGGWRRRVHTNSRNEEANNEASFNRDKVDGDGRAANDGGVVAAANEDDVDNDDEEEEERFRDRPWMSTRRRKQRRKKQYETAGRPGENFQQQTAVPQNGGLISSLAAAAAAAAAAATSSPSSSENNNRHQLGRFILPAVRLALDHINTNNSILGTYKLEIVPRDTQCNATISLKEFFDMVYEEPKKMLLYGDACRVSTDPIAKASYFFDLIQISYADTDPIYTIENYPNFFRVVPSENALSLARIPFIRHFNWTRVGTIYQNLPRYSLPHSKLLTDLERFKIVIKQSVSLPGSIDGLQNRDLGDELRKLKEKDVRIILGNFDEEWALHLFCEAYREKMTGRKYQWILTGVSEDKLWQHYLRKGSECSEQELLIAMDGYIITDITPVTRSQHRTISGMMAHEYSNEYKRRAREMNITIEENKFYGYVYDGIWAIALALHRVDSQLRYYNRLVDAGKAKLNPELHGITSLLDFDYHKPIWVKLIRNALNKTRFNGVTGTVSFHKNERPGLISFSQFQAFRDMNEVIIGSYDALNDELDLKVGFPIFWRGSSPPIDYTIERVTPFRINRTLFVIISILALFGIVLATVFLTINIKFRNQRYIKMSSPYLNNLIIIGCILTYTSVIILGLDSGLTSEYNFPYICNARAWVLMAGFTLAFGSMFSKTFRVHSIFTNIKLHKKVIKDYKLFMVVFILLTFDVCILVIWQYFDPFYRETNNGTSIQDPDSEDIIIVPEMEHCQSKRMTIFLSVIYVYKGLLMAFGCFLAWETRHVSIPALNDSKYIGLSVYNVVIMCVIGAGLSFVLRDQQDASFVIISIFIIFCSTTTLCLVFVPKNPRAGDHRVRATLKTFKKNYHEEAFGAGCRDIHGNLIGRGYGVNLNERIKILLDENIKQRSALKEKTYELEALTYKYRKIQGMIQSGQYLQALSSTSSANNPKLPPSSTTELTNLPTTIVTANPNQGSFSTLRAPPKAAGALVSGAGGGDAARYGNGMLEKSPLMSSATQITTTNTTSSTNNTSELTNDYSTSRLTSNITTMTNGCSLESSQMGAAGAGGKRSMVAFECGYDECNTTSPEQPALRSADAPGRAQRSVQRLAPERGRSVAATVAAGSAAAAAAAPTAGQTKQPPRYTTDSSYCSMGADYELSEPRKSQEELNSFNVMSYIKSGPVAGRPAKRAGDPRRERISRGRYVESKFNRWSEGPFCTLMVRNSDQQAPSGGGAAALAGSALSRPVSPIAKSGENKETSSSGYKSEEIRASCPDIAASSAPRNSRRLKSDDSLQPVKSTTDLGQDGNNGARPRTVRGGTSRLPRTISMIEYLGLSEFDFIAKRHEKLIRRKKLQASRQKQQQQQQLRQQSSACCVDESTHCSCCEQLAAKGKCPAQLDDADMAFSSSEFANSGELARTSSRLSCSTCCSLMTPFYASQSDDMFDDVTTHSGESVSIGQTDSSTGDSSFSAKNSNSDSRSSTPLSSFENQESAIQNTVAASCPIHRLHHHHQQQQPPPSSCARHRKQPDPGSTQIQQTATAAAATTTAKQTDGQHSLCTSGILYGPGSRDDANCAGQVCSVNQARSRGELLSSITHNIIEDPTAEDSDNQETPIIKCDILESL